MTLRQPLLTAALALGLLAGCSSRNTPEPRPAESGGTPSAQMESPPQDKAPAAPTANRGATVFFVKDSGVRCMAAPCPSFIATRPDQPGADGLQVHDVDLSALNLDEEKRAGLLAATHGGPGLKVEATVDTVPNAGPAGAATVLRVTRVVEGK